MQQIKEINFTATRSSGEVTGILNLSMNAEKLLILAHGAGAGMRHSFMEKVSSYLADEGVATFRFNFPYSEKNLKRPDPAPILMETIRSAVAIAEDIVKDISVFVGGKSMGGRMSSMASASEKTLIGVKGLVFFGFPLHAPGKPSRDRAEHLYNVKTPMLFLQGTRDKLADLELLKPIISDINKLATLHIIEGADHSFSILKSDSRKNDDVLKELAKVTSEWMSMIIGISQDQKS